MLDGESFGLELRAMVSNYLAGLEARVKILEARELVPGPPGRNGLGLAGAVIDHAGELVVMLSDGTMRALGAVVGRAGADGRDGRDGLALEDLEADFDGERTLTLRLVRGELVKEIPIVLPIVLDRGVWREGGFVKGDGVSFAGSFWIAQRDTTTKPGEPASDWRLAVKRGRDARAA
jgi:hypothetical protein